MYIIKNVTSSSRKFTDVKENSWRLGLLTGLRNSIRIKKELEATENSPNSECLKSLFDSYSKNILVN